LSVGETLELVVLVGLVEFVVPSELLEPPTR
jgi:hypothetical protein